MAEENAPSAGTTTAPAGSSGTKLRAERAIGDHSGPPGHGGPAVLAGREVRVRRAVRPGAGRSRETREAQFYPEEKSVPVLRGQVGLH